MYLSLVAVMAVPLFLTPWYSHRLLGDLHRWESLVVALDNGAIALGRSDRRTMAELEAVTRELDRWEALHHAAHACARVPFTAAACKPKDLALEGLIRLRFSAAWAAARVRWRAGEAAFHRELGAFGVRGELTGRPAEPPVRPVRCPVCGLRRGWRPLSPSFRTARLRAHREGFPAETAEVELEGAPWQYRLRAGGPDGRP